MSCNKFLVNSGASISIYYYKTKPDKHHDSFLVLADGTLVKNYGTEDQYLVFGPKHYKHMLEVTSWSLINF